MQTQPEFGFRELFSHIVGDMVQAISEREGESQQLRFVRAQAATHMIMDMSPRDGREAMLAGHCVMFHELMVINMHKTLSGKVDGANQRARDNIVPLNKAFIASLDYLTRSQLRHAEGARDEPEAPPPAPATREPAPTETPATDGPVDGLGPEVLARAAEFCHLSPAAIARCAANPAAMAALDAADPVGFAREMGIKEPDPAYVEAASRQMAALNRQMRDSRLTGARKSGDGPADEAARKSGSV
jgi:hypothetical protein